MVVPFLVDFIQPVILPETTGLAPYSDTTTHDDTAEFAAPSVGGVVSGSYATGAATIAVSVIGGTGVLEGGEWLGLIHPTKSYRAYNVTDIDSTTTDSNGNNVYTIGIRPPLRDSIADGAPIDWWRPRCLMRLAPSSTPQIDVEKFWLATPSLNFVEAF